MYKLSPVSSAQTGVYLKCSRCGLCSAWLRPCGRTLKYSTRPRQVILLPLISFTSMFWGLRSHGTSTFRLLRKSPSISGWRDQTERESTGEFRSSWLIVCSVAASARRGNQVGSISSEKAGFRSLPSPSGPAPEQLCSTSCSRTVH